MNLKLDEWFPEKKDGESKVEENSEAHTSNKVNSEDVVKMVEEALAKRLPHAKATEDNAHSEDSEVERGEPSKKKKKKPPKKIKNQK